MSDPIDIFEASAFRQTSNGFILRVPGFWLIGKPRHYLVSEAQKNEIVARVKRGRKRSLLLTFLLWLLVFAGFVAGEAFTLADIAAVTITFAVERHIDWNGLPELHRWYETIMARPAVARGLSAFGT